MPFSLYLIFPIVFFNVVVYLVAQFIGLGNLCLFVSLLATLVSCLYLLPHLSPKKSLHLQLVLPALLLICSTAAVLSPLVLSTQFQGFTFLRMTSVTDYFKHLYTLTALSSYGLPPHHPFFPLAPFTYYYGYYLAPALVAHFLPQAFVLVFYTLTTGTICLLFLAEIYSTFIRKPLLAFFAFIPVVFGLGWDIIPTLIDNRGPGGRLIELWAISHDLGLRVDNPYVSFLWTPQHFFAAVVAITIAYLLLFTHLRSLILFVSLYLYIFISSIFVFIPLLLFTFVYFLFKSVDRFFLLRAGLLSFLLSTPFILSLGNKDGVFSFFTPQPFPFFSNFTLSLITTFFIEYGPLIFFAPLWLFGLRRILGLRLTIFTYLVTLIPFVATWFIRSRDYNDFALRGVLPLQLVLPLIAGWLISKQEKQRFRLATLLLLVITLAGSLPGFFYEFSSRWRERQLLDLDTSNLVSAVRTLPQNTTLAVPGRAEWIYFIPSLGYHPITTGSLYDSAVYLGGLAGDPHTRYEILEQEIFFTQTIDNSLPATLDQRNQKLDSLSEYFSIAPAKYYLLTRTLGAKNSPNPWYELFSQLSISTIPLTDRYQLFSLPQLLDFSLHNRLQIGAIGQSLAKGDRKFFIPAGNWFLVSCNTADSRPLRLELENHYQVFSGQVAHNGCIGNFFSQSVSAWEPLAVTTIVDELTAYPVKIIWHDR